MKISQKYYNQKVKIIIKLTCCNSKYVDAKYNRVSCVLNSLFEKPVYKKIVLFNEKHVS